MGYTCNKSSPNRMRSSGPTGGNSTKPFDSQPPLLGFSWMGDSLLEGSAQSAALMTTRPGGNIAVAEREGGNSFLRLNGGRTHSLMGITPFPRYLACKVSGTPNIIVPCCLDSSTSAQV